MQFEDQPESEHVEDRRGDAPPSMGGGYGLGGFGGGLGGLPFWFGRGGLGLGGLVLLLVLAWAGGLDPMALLNGRAVPQQRSAEPRSQPSRTADPTDDARVTFCKQVLRTTETCWRDLFREHFGKAYELPTLVLFRDAVRSACGTAGSSVGPFYCPGDQKLYLDLSFFDEMERSLGARGDFAQAYVIAHEVGHHVQNLLGTNRKVESLRRLGSDADYRRASIQLELQADYYAGVWAHYVEHRLQGKVKLDAGDYEEAITAAQAIGDDTLQKRATGTVVPEKFTHGTAAQRSKWFRLGYESGDPKRHDPFVEEKGK
jgi:hypothetical protein